MPSPYGHVLGGVATAWAMDLIPGTRAWRTAAPTASLYRRAGGTLTAVCAGLAAIPDVDLLVDAHRTVTHSLTATLLVIIVAAGVTRWVTQHSDSHDGRVGRIVLMCGLAYASHLVLDWLTTDPFPPFGIRLFWPFSDRWVISGLDLFPRTERHDFLSRAALDINLYAFVWETILLLPVVLVLWSVRVKALARFAAELSRGNHAA